jgi:hypothetical protein
VAFSGTQIISILRQGDAGLAVNGGLDLKRSKVLEAGPDSSACTPGWRRPTRGWDLTAETLGPAQQRAERFSASSIAPSWPASARH